MSYPGNSSLAPEIQNRILSTFRQTIDLAEKGRLQEARLGCEFILKMDSQFAAARQLKERLEGASGPVKASDLEIGATAQPSPVAPAAPAAPAPPARSAPAAPAPVSSAASSTADPFGDLAGPGGSLDLDLGDDFGDLDFGEPVREAAPPADAFADLSGSVAAADLLGSLNLDLDDEPPAPAGAAHLEPPRAQAPPPAVAPPLEPLAAAPAAATSSGNPRIDELLNEGQAAFEQGEYQSAIDAWSRIFLIDIDHEEAGRRIEEARSLKAERERQGDELLNEALRAREEGRLDAARDQLENLLVEQPENLQAREMLEQLRSSESGEAPPPPPSPATLGGPLDAPAVEEVLQDIPPPTPRSAGPAPSSAFPGGTGKAKRGGGRSLQLVGAFVFLLVLVGAWFLYSNWGSLFPNAVVEEPVAQAPQRPSPLRRANQLRLDGNVAAAIEVLKGVTADHPEADQARTLLDQLEAEIAAKAAEDQAAADLEASRQASRQRFLEEARRAYDERRYLEAARTFRAANDLEPLDGPAADLYRDAREQLLPIAQQIDLFRQREWDQVLPTLWRKLEEDRSNQDVRRLLADSYFNLAIQDLRRGDAKRAFDSLKEVVDLDADDALAARLLDFATGYRDRPVDLLYRIFVGKLEFRT